MRICVIGAGVVGVTAAHALADRGHEVEVLEARGMPAAAASGVNAGLLVPGDSLVWGSPAVPGLLVRALLARDPGFLRIRPRAAGPGLVPWGLRFLRECTPARARGNVVAAHALSRYSYDVLERLLAELEIDAGHARRGMLLLYEEERSLEQGLRALDVLAAQGERYRVLSAADVVALDPAYAGAAERLAGAVLSESCGHGDCAAFTGALARRCAEAGVAFSFGRPVRGISLPGHGGVVLATDAGDVAADACVLAAGSWSARLARTAGARVAVMPAKGYAITVPAAPGRRLPQLGGIAADRFVAFSPMGDRLRLTSTAELSGFDESVEARDVAPIRRAAEQLFPGVLGWGDARLHSGLRPATPSGTPLVGPLRPGLFVATGHGHLGWTQACGSARLLADLVDGRRPDLDPAPYLPAGRGAALTPSHYNATLQLHTRVQPPDVDPA